MYKFEDYVKKAGEANAQNKMLYILITDRINEDGQRDRDLVIAEPDYYVCKDGTNITDGTVNPKFEEIKKEKKQYILRKKRVRECFEIINRGKIWYDTLTVAQLDELKEWYRSWLNVTETLKEPVTPDWL